MDPISATSIAAAAIQFVDFSAKVIFKTVQIHKSSSGSSADHDELEEVTRDLTLVCQNLDKSIASEASQHLGLQKPSPFKGLGVECQNVAAELLGALNKLKATGKHSKCRSFRQALLAVYKEGEIKALENRLGRFREQLTLRLLESLHNVIQGYYVTNKKPEGIERQDTGIAVEILEHLKASREWEKHLIDALHQNTGKTLLGSKPMLEPPSTLKTTLEMRLQQSLRFHEIDDRHERIPKALQDTFEWTYRPAGSRSKWASIVDWLQRGDAIYWITGKPGSGKSTLMKFIHDEKRTKRALEVWANGATLVAAGFYFWNSGEQVQMSLEGLFQSLLYSVVKERKELIPQLFPSRWEVLNLFGHDNHAWLLTECVDAIRRLASPVFSEYRFFFLIDGLDEYCGDHSELIHILHELVQASHIKLCVSSREWVVFQDAFSQLPSLLLQDLTSEDIQIYVRRRFEDHEGFNRMRKREPAFALELIDEVARRSSGVFLWVRLVVQSLLHGISNADRLSDLHRRLEQLPDDLESLFRKIFDSMDRFYLEHACQLFQIHRAHGPMSGLRFSFADEESESAWKTGRHKPLAPDDIVYTVDQMKRRIDSRTKGLLEMDNWRRPVRDNSSEQHYQYLATQCQVQYLHRTVKDFIETESLWKEVILPSTPGFDPYLSLLKALTLDIMTWDRKTSGPEHLNTSICEALCWASAVDPKSHRVAIEMLDALDQAVDEIWRDPKTHGLLPSLAMSDGQRHLLPLALRLNMDWWVRHLLVRRCPVSPPRPLRPYTFFTVEKIPVIECPKGLTVPALDKPSTDCMRVLLEYGASIYDRNDDDMPLWKYVRFEFRSLCNCYPGDYRPERGDFEYWCATVEMLIQFGADAAQLDTLFSSRKHSAWNREWQYRYYSFRETLSKIGSPENPTFDAAGLSPRKVAIERLKRRRAKRQADRATRRTLGSLHTFASAR
ncbi:hypothetical protein QBC35DRAFT_32649 [Podospora australis]|uniref:NACHT domain-containing protein n=1 Tax=Podospora australis TaxID=1536484 RepID=A0AAN7AF66_9PEZI|nr:hypothetical protein QBC35DRAFT_32649 [Podospora australis]